MTIHLDTSALIDLATSPQPLLPALRATLRAGHALTMSSIVVYEWLRGPRHDVELELQRELCPDSRVITFGPTDAALAAELYRAVRRARGRDIDLAIAACAIANRAALWTTNVADFQDIPGLQLYVP